MNGRRQWEALAAKCSKLDLICRQLISNLVQFTVVRFRSRYFGFRCLDSVSDFEKRDWREMGVRGIAAPVPRTEDGRLPVTRNPMSVQTLFSLARAMPPHYFLQTLFASESEISKLPASPLSGALVLLEVHVALPWGRRRSVCRGSYDAALGSLPFVVAEAIRTLSYAL